MHCIIYFKRICFLVLLFHSRLRFWIEVILLFEEKKNQTKINRLNIGWKERNVRKLERTFQKGEQALEVSFKFVRRSDVGKKGWCVSIEKCQREREKKWNFPENARCVNCALLLLLCIRKKKFWKSKVYVVFTICHFTFLIHFS